MVPTLMEGIWNLIGRARHLGINHNKNNNNHATCDGNGGEDRIGLEPRRPLTPGPETTTTETNPQAQSPFFSRLPPEIRLKIYLSLFGDRRVHLAVVSPLLKGPRGETYRGESRWGHRICTEQEAFPDRCGCMYCEKNPDWEARKGIVRADYKLAGLAWLRCCRRGYKESLAVLYGSNTFILEGNNDWLFWLAKRWPASHRSLITSFDIKFFLFSGTIKDGSRIPEEQYRAFFALLHSDRFFPNVRSLRVVIRFETRNLFLARHDQPAGLTADQEEAWVRPWEDLVAAGRERSWRRLEIFVPESWKEELAAVVQNRGQLEGSDLQLRSGPEYYPYLPLTVTFPNGVMYDTIRNQRIN
ncbi:hypothetical protein VTN77DRAFT_7909 [Rasamsonia byssochlamydoides]|uniref:uncharacterized protein n=1 Tax=Rasamsonia byssochlamydoides TaxID=89139 RepID=UPI003743E1B4